MTDVVNETYANQISNGRRKHLVSVTSRPPSSKVQ